MCKDIEKQRRKIDRIITAIYELGIDEPHPALESAVDSLKEANQHLYIASLAHQQVNNG